MYEVAVYLTAGAGAVMVVLSSFSLYLRSRYFFWMIIIAGCVGLTASVWAVLSTESDHWYKALLYGGGFLVLMQTVSKKYIGRVRFFGSSKGNMPH